MNKSYFLHTNRLYVTKPSKADLDYLCLLQSNAEVMRYFGGIRTPEEVKQRLDFFLEHYKKHNLGYGLVFNNETNAFVGRAGLNIIEFKDESTEIELGVILMPSTWNQGFGQELVTGLIQYGLTECGLSHINAVIDEKNTRSISMVTKAQMHPLGTISYFGETKLLFRNNSTTNIYGN